MKKLLALFILTILLTSCSSDKKEVLKSYNSPYTICYDNKDGTYSLYIYSSPIMYKNNNKFVLIDNTIVSSNKNNYIYKNKANSINIYFPQYLSDYIMMEKDSDIIKIKAITINSSMFKPANKIDYINIYNDKVSAVKYESISMDYIFYCTKAGVKCEMVLKNKPKENSFDFSLISPNTDLINDKNGYLIIKKDSKNYGVIYSPIVKGSKENYSENDDNFSINNDLGFIMNPNDYNINIKIDQSLYEKSDLTYPVKIDMTFEFYINKMPDTGVFSNQINKNSYLLNYSPIGNNAYWGESMQYVRLRINYYIDILPKDIVSAKYYIKELSGFNSDMNVSLYSAETNWSSTQMTWKDKVNIKDLICTQTINKSRYYEFDITEFAKECADDINSTKESAGFVLKSEPINNCRFFASSDNTLYTPYTVITLNKLPYSFYYHDNINPE